MKILMVSSFLPYPLYSGGYIRLYNLIKHLSKEHQITLVCERRPTESDEDVREVEKICKKVVTVPRKKQWSLKNVFSAGFSMSPFLITGHTLPEMKQKIKEELDAENFDLIHVETFYVMQNLPKTYLPIILAEHNIEYLVYKRFADTANPAIRPLLYWDIQKLRKKERASWKKATAVVAVSESERQQMGTIADDKTYLVPNGVDIQKFTLKKEQKEKKQKRILFIGDFRWIQNRDAAKFIIQEIWPLIAERNALSAKRLLWVVGRKIPKEIRELSSDSSIVFDEHVADTAKAFREADVLLAPIRIGGGTQYKILEAMASGTPVVTTTLGMEGLDISEGKEILVSDTAEGLADQVERLLGDRKLYKTVAEKARKKIEEEYTWESITKKLDEVYKIVVTK